jgi:hypothetical protein
MRADIEKNLGGGKTPKKALGFSFGVKSIFSRKGEEKIKDKENALEQLKSKVVQKESSEKVISNPPQQQINTQEDQEKEKRIEQAIAEIKRKKVEEEFRKKKEQLQIREASELAKRELKKELPQSPQIQATVSDDLQESAAQAEEKQEPVQEQFIDKLHNLKKELDFRIDENNKLEQKNNGLKERALQLEKNLASFDNYKQKYLDNVQAVLRELAKSEEEKERFLQENLKEQLAQIIDEKRIVLEEIDKNKKREEREKSCYTLFLERAGQVRDRLARIKEQRELVTRSLQDLISKNKILSEKKQQFETLEKNAKEDEKRTIEQQRWELDEKLETIERERWGVDDKKHKIDQELQTIEKEYKELVELVQKREEVISKKVDIKKEMEAISVEKDNIGKDLEKILSSDNPENLLNPKIEEFPKEKNEKEAKILMQLEEIRKQNEKLEQELESVKEAEESGLKLKEEVEIEMKSIQKKAEDLKSEEEVLKDDKAQFEGLGKPKIVAQTPDNLPAEEEEEEEEYAVPTNKSESSEGIQEAINKILIKIEDNKQSINKKEDSLKQLQQQIEEKKKESEKIAVKDRKIQELLMFVQGEQLPDSREKIKEQLKSILKEDIDPDNSSQNQSLNSVQQDNENTKKQIDLIKKEISDLKSSLKLASNKNDNELGLMEDDLDSKIKQKNQELRSQKKETLLKLKPLNTDYKKILLEEKLLEDNLLKLNNQKEKIKSTKQIKKFEEEIWEQEKRRRVVERKRWEIEDRIKNIRKNTDIAERFLEAIKNVALELDKINDRENHLRKNIQQNEADWESLEKSIFEFADLEEEEEEEEEEDIEITNIEKELSNLPASKNSWEDMLKEQKRKMESVQNEILLRKKNIEESQNQVQKTKEDLVAKKQEIDQKNRWLLREKQMLDETKKEKDGLRRKELQKNILLKQSGQEHVVFTSLENKPQDKNDGELKTMPSELRVSTKRRGNLLVALLISIILIVLIAALIFFIVSSNKKSDSRKRTERKVDYESMFL